MKKYKFCVISFVLGGVLLCGCDPIGEQEVVPIKKIGSVEKINAIEYRSSNSSAFEVDPKTELDLGNIPVDNYTGDYDDGSYPLPFLPENEVVLKYDWTNLGVSIDEAPEYPYGFDKLPSDDSHVYVSVAEGERASVSLRLSDAAFSQYILKNDLTGAEYSVTNGINTIASDGDYTLYGKADATSTPVSLNKHLKVISYKPKIKDIYFIPLNYGYDPTKDTYAFYTKRLKDSFDEIYRQAVISANVIERDPSFYDKGNPEIDLSKIIQVNMFDRHSRILDEMVAYAGARAAEELEKAKSEAELTSTDIDFTKIQERYVVFTINKERKYWPMESVYGGDGALNRLGINPFSATNPTYAIKSIGSCEDGVGPNPIPVTIRGIDGFLYAYNNGKKVKFGHCDVIYTDDEIPVVPGGPGTYASTGPLAYDGVYFGGIIVYPRPSSLPKYYALFHELGHSFGLTDLVQNNKTEEGVATTETNLMSWTLPIGKKLRYNGVQAAYSGGSVWRQECPVWNDDKTPVLQNQWDCLQGACDKKEYWTDANPVYRFYRGLDFKGENTVTASYNKFCWNKEDKE